MWYDFVMSKVSILDAKTNLSRYLEEAEKGEIIVICRHNKPVAELRGIPAPTPPPERTPGHMQGQISWKPNAFQAMTEAEAADFLGE